MYGLAILIAKDDVRRNRLIEALRDAHFAQNRRRARLLRARGKHEQRHRRNNKPRFVSCDQGFPLPFAALNLRKSWRGFTCNRGPVGNCRTSENGDAGARLAWLAEKYLNIPQQTIAVNTSTRLRRTRKPITPRTFASRVS